jgi:hypothetical protein
LLLALANNGIELPRSYWNASFVPKCSKLLQKTPKVIHPIVFLRVYIRVKGGERYLRRRRSILFKGLFGKNLDKR